jgi:GDPmannose 4,6-dehydratase
LNLEHGTHPTANRIIIEIKRLNMNKVALITGITGQDGAYLAEFLIKKGYTVHGMKRRSSLINTDRVDHIYQDPHIEKRNFILHYGDLSDSMNVTKVIQECQPDEIYNLGAMSHVKVSFDVPEYTANTDGIGTLRVLEAVRLLGLKDKTRIYQASTSELYGLVQEVPQSEKTPFYPRSPYAVAKLYAYWITVNYREAYGIHASNGILFNHESPIRGETFVSRKITRALARIVLGMQDTLFMGNMSSKRDWGHAKDYIKAMYLILQQDKPDDYVIATGITTEVREFIRLSFASVGVEMSFTGEKERETGRITSIDESVFFDKVGGEHLAPFKARIKTDPVIVKVDPAYYRPTEVDLLLGDPSKANEKLGWKPEYDLNGLIQDMVMSDLVLMKKEHYLKIGGYKTMNYFE